MPDWAGGMRVAPADLAGFARERGLELLGRLAQPLTGAGPLDSAAPHQVTFCRFEDENGLEMIQRSQAGALFVPAALAGRLPTDGTAYLPAPHPRLEMLRFLATFWHEPAPEYDMDANPCIHPDAKIAPDAAIGPFTVIGPDVRIGDGSRVGSNCHLEHVVVGRDTTIANAVTIGGAGFGYEDDPETGEVLQFPHIGGVVIGDRVEIGSSTCIDRGSIGDTEIGNDCKIDNLVHIAHNVRMGRRCKVIALAIVGGSVELGDDAWIAPAAAVRDWRRVGSGAVVGLGAVVTKDVADGETVAGNPARPIARTRHRYK